MIHLDRHAYLENFPTNVPLKTAQGFLATAAISVIFNGENYRTALLRGSLAALISLVEAVTRPIIKAFFPDTPLVGRIIQIFVTPITLEMLVSRQIGLSHSPNMIFSIVTWFVLNSGFYDRNEGMAEVL